jgi:hypothetical protein
VSVKDQHLQAGVVHETRPMLWVWRAGASVSKGVFWALLVAWWFAIITTDVTLLGQFLFWGHPLLIVGAGVMLVLAAIVRFFGGAPRPWAFRWRAGILALCSLLMAASVLRVPALFHSSDVLPPGGAGKTLDILHWNRNVFNRQSFSVLQQNLRDMDKEGGKGPDIFLISMENIHEQLVGLDEMFGGSVGGPGSGLEQRNVFHVNNGMEKVYSRVPVVSARRFFVPLSTPDPTDPAVLEKVEVPTWAKGIIRRAFRTFGLKPRSVEVVEDADFLVLVFDTRAKLGHLTTVYWIDLPSNPVAPRMSIARRVAARIAQVQRSSQGFEACPPPDIIVGDFNIPRSSASLSVITGPMRALSDDAGVGPLASWPRPRELLHIDLAFAAEGWKCSTYQLIDMGESEHFAQRFIVWK